MNTAQVDSDALDRSAPDEPEVLALVDGPAPDRAAWVAAVDAVLRRAKRLDDAAPPGSGVEALTRTTPDGIAVPPLYTAADVADLADVGVPGAAAVRAGRPGARCGARRLGRPFPARRTGPDGRARGPTHRPRERRHVGLARGRRDRAPRSPTSRPCSTACCSTSRRSLTSAADPDVAVGRGAGLPRPRRRTRRPGRRARHAGPRPRRGRGPAPAPARRSTPSSRSPCAASRDSPLVRAVVVDGLPVHVAGGSDSAGAGLPRSPPGSPTCARSPRPASTLDAARPPAGVPARRHRRAVPDDREAARGAPAVGAGAAR